MTTTYELCILGGDVVTLYPDWDLTIEKKQVRSEKRSQSGYLRMYKWYDYRRISFKNDWVPASDAALVNSWWDSNANLLFLITSGDFTDVHSVMMINDETPLAQYNKPYNEYYKGKIELEGGRESLSPGDTLNLTKYADADVDITITLSLPANKTVYIYWGDGNYSTVTGPQTTTGYNHTYASAAANYQIKIIGDLDSITYFYCYNEPVSGDIANFSGLTSLITLELSLTSVSGDIANLSGLTSLAILSFAQTSVSGNISALSGLTSLTYLHLESTSVSGDIVSLSGLTSLTYLGLGSTSVDTYTQGTLPNWDACNIYIQNLGLTQQEVDDFLCDLNTASTASTKTLNIAGTNSAPSATGLTCKTALEGKGWTVTVTT